MKKLLTVVFFLSLSTNAAADFITADSVSSLNSSPWSNYNNVNSLIENAIGTSYLAPNPSGGGGGTSTYTDLSFNTWTFDFGAAHMLDTAYIWDYYGHSPTEWILSFFDAANGGGTQLASHAFSLAPLAPSGSSILHTVLFTDVGGVMSATLSSTNLSTGGGVGLAEVHFGGTVTAVPEPSTLAILGLGLLGLASRKFKKQA
jgi:hypothetical protein